MDCDVAITAWKRLQISIDIVFAHEIFFSVQSHCILLCNLVFMQDFVSRDVMENLGYLLWPS